MKRNIRKCYCWFGLLFIGCSCLAQGKVIQERIAPGVIKLTVGEVDPFTPFQLLGQPMDTSVMAQVPLGQLPFSLEKLQVAISDRGCTVEIPLGKEEQLYGFGLQMETFGQRGLKRRPVVNDHPLNSLGYTHAPQPFYVSTAGYGILVNTAHYTTFYCGTNQKTRLAKQQEQQKIVTSPEELYRNQENGEYVFIDIPHVQGIEVFLIQGRDLLDVVRRYNLLGGGGCLPPMWGLGFKYRVKGDAVQDTVRRFANYFREREIPCDVLGLEPGWQTKAYSCSYVWSDRFPGHQKMLKELAGQGYQVNLWEHAYIHPASPLWQPMEKMAGDFLVWNGLVPDFVNPEARRVFAEYHDGLVEEGIRGFKLDECDNSNIAEGYANWGFPDMTQFPSGIDGEQMHQLFGSLYVKTMSDLFRQKNIRTYLDYRSSGLFMTSVSAALYSDTYDHHEYIRMICNGAFGGLLWTPEVREAKSEQDFFHRLQTVLLSPQGLVNAWYLQYAPWLQFDKDKNNRGEFADQAAQWEGWAREFINIRMQLIPYLYAAFADYQQKGIPPFRPLVMDFPQDQQTRKIDDQYMMGADLMAAPLYMDSDRREVYFPEGIWYDFNTYEKYEGGKTYEIRTPLNRLPLYVKAGTLLPLAKSIQAVRPETTFELNCLIFDKGDRPCWLFEDDGITYNYEKGDFNRVELRVERGKVKMKRTGNFKPYRYKIVHTQFIHE